MSNLNKSFTSLKQRMVVRIQFLSYQAREYPKRFYTILLSILVLLTMVFSVTLISRKHIRNQQIETLIFQSISTKIVTPTTDLSNLKKEPAATVFFANPSAKNYEAVFQLLSRKEKELNRSIYFYPIVYDKKDLSQEYQINPNEMTFVFFEKGKEKNRFTFEELETPTNELMPELNRLPMWNTKTLDTQQKENQKN